MIQLSIDTCNSLCAVALSRWQNDRLQLVAKDTRDLGRGHAEVLIGQIAQLLAESGLRAADLQRIAVTTGPGSFTGQRVGLAAARVLSASLNIEAVGVGVLDALVRQAAGQNPSAQTFCAICDARRDAAYVKAVDRDGTVRIKASLIQVSDLAAQIDILPEPLCLIGSGVSLVEAATGVAPSQDRKCLDIAFPDIATIAELGHTMNAADNPAKPLYLRGADAKPQSAKHVLRPAATDHHEVSL
tara:strand:+ start:3828 stop:4556 length:729 start_codon:yes stop_codon:yes gene_type:complete